MQKVIEGLEALAVITKKAAQSAPVSEAIQKLRKEITPLKMKPENAAVLQTLDEELGIWLKKLDVILKEQAGREGMVRHSRHWAERLTVIARSEATKQS